MAYRKRSLVYLHMPNEASALLVRAVLEYEAAARGVSLGRAFAELVAESVDVGTYPADLQERIESARERKRQRAIREALASSRGGKVA